jgi:hypothetical protein
LVADWCHSRFRLGRGLGAHLAARVAYDQVERDCETFRAAVRRREIKTETNGSLVETTIA